MSLTAVAAFQSAPAFAAQQPALSASAPTSVAPLTSTNCKSYCAAINADGTIYKAHAHTTASQIGTGAYQVSFFSTATTPINISACVWTATPGFGAFSGSQVATFVTTAGRVGTTNGVYVATYDQTGAVVNAPFLLLVSC